jgi:hypothetical protein
MDAARNFAAVNRAGIINVIYLVAFAFVLYYVYKFFTSQSELEAALLNVEQDANKGQVFSIPTTSDLRVKQGGEYTISFWMYVTSWEYNNSKPKSVMQIYDSRITDHSLLTAILYAHEPKMMIRAYTPGTAAAGVDYTSNANFAALVANASAEIASSSGLEMPMCDIQDIDMQRWINVTISVNGRIMDVYYDGKLARSCVLPDVTAGSMDGQQSVVIGDKGGFGGKVSGIQFFAYALTPDRIYSIYQAGPTGAAGFLGYVGEKLGIRLTYSGQGGAARSFGV